MNTVTINQLELPETFQADFLKKVFRLINQSESGLMIAPAGMGKTLVLDLLETKLQKETVLRLDLTGPNWSNLSNSSNSLVIIGDNAEALTKETVQKLKSLREKNRSQTSIILAAERNVLESSAFSENSSLRSILMENILYLPPLSEADSKAFAKAIAKQANANLTAKHLDQIAKQSGGAPRIIKRLVKLTLSGENPATDAKLQFDLETLVSFKEQNPGYPLDVSKFAKSDQFAKSKDVVGEISFQKSLTKQEFALAKILIEAKGELVDREAMIKAIWPNNRYDTSEHALDQMIHRLRKKMESSTPKCTLTTYRGRGAKLTTV